MALLLAVTMIAACKKEPEPMADANPEPPRGTPQWKIVYARSAAPAQISANATVQDVGATDSTPGDTLARGDNGWTCMPDNPRTDANDPWCIDEESQKIMAAFATRTAPRLSGMAIAYMLQGGVSASDTDPFKMRPDSGQQWIVDPPSILIMMPSARSYAGLPTTRRTDGPWVRWSGTPYAHIVVPASAGETP